MNKGLIAGIVIVLVLVVGYVLKKQQADTVDPDTITPTTVSATAVQFTDGIYTLDTAKSEVTWKATKLAGTASHTGKVPVSGSVTVTSTALIGGEITFDIQNLTNDDLKDPKENKKLVDHLKSTSFFNTASAPIATYTVKGIFESVDGPYVDGTLTVKGIAKDQPIKVAVTSKDPLAFEGTTEIKASDFNIVADQKLKAVVDDVLTIGLKISFIKQ